MTTIAELRQLRAETYAKLTPFVEMKGILTPDNKTAFDGIKGELAALDAQIERAVDHQQLMVQSVQPVADQAQPVVRGTVAASPETDAYVKDKSLVIGASIKMMAQGNGSLFVARQVASEVYGENHPVTKALIVSSGASGGFIVPPDYVNSIIELLRPMAVVRSAGPRNIPMPRGTMTLPGQASAATATYGTEGSTISASQPKFNQITATYKKLTALVPVSNDMMRYADPAIDAIVRDDLVLVTALREDLAFIMGDGTNATPRGFVSFANAYAVEQAGTAGTFVTGANGVYATGGNFITANMTVTQATVTAELAGAVNKLDTANVPDRKRVWFFHPRTYNYLYNAINSLGMYVWRDELNRGTLLGYPFKKTTQIPVNLYDSSSTNKDLTLIFLVEMTDDMILDSMTLELAVSREGSYTDSNSNTVSAFTTDQTIIRAIMEHDHQVRHDAAIAVIQNVRYAPTLT
jgi:HK97 family phage major capsid protein